MIFVYLASRRNPRALLDPRQPIRSSVAQLARGTEQQHTQQCRTRSTSFSDSISSPCLGHYYRAPLACYNRFGRTHSGAQHRVHTVIPPKLPSRAGRALSAGFLVEGFDRGTWPPSANLVPREQGFMASCATGWRRAETGNGEFSRRL